MTECVYRTVISLESRGEKEVVGLGFGLGGSVERGE